MMMMRIYIHSTHHLWENEKVSSRQIIKSRYFNLITEMLYLYVLKKQHILPEHSSVSNHAKCGFYRYMLLKIPLQTVHLKFVQLLRKNSTPTNNRGQKKSEDIFIKGSSSKQENWRKKRIRRHEDSRGGYIYSWMDWLNNFSLAGLVCTARNWEIWTLS